MKHKTRWMFYKTFSYSFNKYYSIIDNAIEASTGDMDEDTVTLYLAYYDPLLT
jgi:hypothetical protein